MFIFNCFGKYVGGARFNINGVKYNLLCLAGKATRKDVMDNLDAQLKAQLAIDTSVEAITA